MGRIVLFFIFVSCIINMNAQKVPYVSNSDVITSANENGTAINERDTILQKLINNMIRVEGGTFTMGSVKNAWDDEKPTHVVTLSSFYIGKFEVTQEEWEAVMGSNPSYIIGAKRPVEDVSWNDCQTFIEKLNKLTGFFFRLPTEAEWEYAARGGNCSKGYRYAGSNSLKYVAWYYDNSYGETQDVGTKFPNELGLYDMSGNVMEWCQDWYGEYESTNQVNPKGPSTGSSHVIRGGSSFLRESHCTVSSRLRFSEGDDSDFHLGFRLAL